MPHPFCHPLPHLVSKVWLQYGEWLAAHGPHLIVVLLHGLHSPGKVYQHHHHGLQFLGGPIVANGYIFILNG